MRERVTYTSGDSAFIPGYHRALRPAQDLLAALARGPVDAEPTDLVKLTYESLVHEPPVEIGLKDNWILWSLGQLNPDFLVTQQPRRIAAGGSGLCGDAVIVLLGIAERAGVEARMVGLKGHVVCILETTEGWRVADPDFGIIFPFDLPTLSSPAGIERVRTELTRRGHSPETIDAYVAAAASPEGNTVLEAGVLSPRWARFEEVTEWLKWVFPLAGVALLALWSQMSGCRRYRYLPR